MQHPLYFLSTRDRKRLFFAFLTGTLILFAVFRVLDAPLRTSAAPNGIVSFELAGTPEKTFQMLVSWESASDEGPGNKERQGYLYAAFGLGLDYLFMPVYATALALGILLAAGRHRGWFASLGAWLGWGTYAAALFDAVENFALWKVLLGNVFSAWPAVAYVCATLKFGLLALGLIFALMGWLLPQKNGYCLSAVFFYIVILISRPISTPSSFPDFWEGKSTWNLLPGKCTSS